MHVFVTFIKPYTNIVRADSLGLNYTTRARISRQSSIFFGVLEDSADRVHNMIHETNILIVKLLFCVL